MEVRKEFSRRALLRAAVGSGVAVLAACDARIRNEKDVSVQAGDPIALAQAAAGFSVGSPTARSVAYVFFDMQCPHCARLWQATKPLQDRVRFVWIPVSIVNSTSLEQGAAVLAADEPGSMMNRHEENLLAGGNGMAAQTGTAAGREKVQANTRTLGSLGAESVPYIVSRNVNSDRTVTHAGALSTGDLAALLGV